MALKVVVESVSIDPGLRRCMSAQGDPHGATWEFALRVEERGALILAAPTEKGARHGWACDAHLYPIVQHVHNEIQAMHGLRTAISESAKALA